MVKIVDDSFMVCGHCLQGIVNDDYTGIHYGEMSNQEVDERIDDIQKSIAAVDGNICLGDSERDVEFSVAPCDCCHADTFHGRRHHMVVLK